MNDEHETQDQVPEGGLDRRALLRRGAILGGAIVWTTPVVQSLATPAFAGTPKPHACMCKVRFQWGAGTGFSDSGDGVATGAGNACCVADNYLTTTARVGIDGSIPSCTLGGKSLGTVTVSYPVDGDRTKAVIGLPLACTLEDGDAKGGSCVSGTVDCSDATEIGTTSTQRLYSVDLARRDISHITGVICC